MYFNSKNRNYKSVFGAIKNHQPITFKVFAPDSDGVNMLIRLGEKNDYVAYPMKRVENGWFENFTSFNECGVYFYHFEIFYNRHRQSIFRGENLVDTVTGNADWQQTVYDEKFTTPDWIKGGLIYQIFPDRFYKANIKYSEFFPDRVNADWSDEPIFKNGTVGAVINNDYFGGNLKGVEEKLDYLSELGVTAIYFNPIFEAHSNHRYNTANYLKVDAVLGTNDDFKHLCNSAKSKGIGIILDGVFSHTGSDSIYFNKNSRYDDLGAYQSKNSPYYSWYKFKKFPDEYLSWWGFETLPEVQEEDENYSNFITGEGGVIDYWMGLGASGFRLDVADELPDDFIKKIRTAVKRNNGILYGEVWEDASNKVSYGAQREFLYGNELDSVMNYPFAELITAFVKGNSGVDFINRVESICENYPKPTLDTLMNLLGTHDTERILTILGGEPAIGRDRAWQAVQKMSSDEVNGAKILLKMATVLQYTLPGVPCVYYGDEICTQGYRDPFNRTSFKWEKANDNNDLLNWYKMLGVLRKHCPALDGGEFIPAQFESGYVSFLRVKDGNELFVVVNPSPNNVDIWLLPGWKDDVSLLGNENVNGILTVEPKSVAIMGRGDWCKNLKLRFD